MSNIRVTCNVCSNSVVWPMSGPISIPGKCEQCGNSDLKLDAVADTPPAASGQQEVPADGWALPDVIEALRASGFEVRGEDATAIVYGTVEAGAVLLDASIEVFSQQESKGLELPDDHPISVHLRGLGIEPAAHPAPAQQESVEHVAEIITGWQIVFAGSGPIAPIVERHGLKIGTKLYTRAPAPAALTDAEIHRIATDCGMYEQHDNAKPSASVVEDFAHAILATASAAPAEQARDAALVAMQDGPPIPQWYAKAIYAGWQARSGNGLTYDEFTGKYGQFLRWSNILDLYRDKRPSNGCNPKAIIDAAIASQQKGGDGHG